MKMKIVKLTQEDNVVTMNPQEIEEEDITTIRKWWLSGEAFDPTSVQIWEAYLQGEKEKVQFVIPTKELERLIARDAGKMKNEMTDEEIEAMKEHAYWKRYWKEHPEEYKAIQAQASQKEIGASNEQGQ